MPCRPLRIVLATMLVALSACHPSHRRRAVARRAVGGIQRLGEARRAPHAYGRTGDLVLLGTDGTALVFATGPDVPGHRPIRGAMVDAAMGPADDAMRDTADALIAWRTAWTGADGIAHPLVADRVEPTRCAGGDAGVRVSGTVDGLALERIVCARPGARFDVMDRFVVPDAAQRAQATLGDELTTGVADVLVDRVGAAWEDSARSRFLAFAGAGTAACIGARDAMDVQRRTLHIAAEVFHDPVRTHTTRFVPSWVRTLRLARGDALTALSLAPVAMHTVRVTGADEGASLDVRDEAGRLVASGALARTITLPAHPGTVLRARDGRGVAAREVPVSSDSLALDALPAGLVRLRYTEDGRVGLPVHVMFHGLDGTPDPVPLPLALSPTVRAAGRSLYLGAGEGIVALAPGRYRVTASHGPTFALAVDDVSLVDGATLDVSGTLARVVDTTGWTSADFHLHAAPSADSSVSLEERVLALACAGVELAVATDHNRITDYAPTTHALGFDTVLATAPGVEVTSAGARLFGHFNAFPLPADAMLAPEDQAPPYFDTPPAAIFAAARSRGARVVEVNHPRMAPSIGYFDQTTLETATGRAGPLFSDAFDAVEAFNGMWIETPERVREGVRDLVALARRGMQVAATGNSDSHRLVYEEAGWPRTYVRALAQPVEGRAARAFDALLRHETTVGSGPFVEMTVDGRPIGATVSALGGSVRVHVRVRAPAWIPVDRVEVLLDGEPVRAVPVGASPVDGVRAEGDVTVAIAHDAVLMAWADAVASLPDVLPYPAARSIGFTGLVYVDADGDHRVVVPPAP